MANKVVWTFNAMACIPAGAPIARDLYDSLAGGVRFREGKFGNIALICPISDDLGGTALLSLHLTYRDSGSQVILYDNPLDETAPDIIDELISRGVTVYS